MASTATLTASQVSLSIGKQHILVDVDLRVLPGRRVGLTGPNGVGKSTLLRILAGDLLPESGAVHTIPTSAAVGYLHQEPERPSTETAEQFIMRKVGLYEAQLAYDNATQALANGNAGADDAFAVALENWLDRGAVDADTRLGEICHTLGIAPELLTQTMDTLSGGQAARIGLAALLLSRFEVLLLDEPTNDLDLDGLARLEQFVLTAPQGMVIVSHDRTFLERVVTDVAELDEHNHTLSLYAGGWEAFQTERETARRHATEAFDQFSTTRDSLQSRAQREREWSTQGIARAKRQATDRDVAGLKFRAENTEQLAAKASRTMRQIERLVVVDKPWEGWDLRMKIATAARSGAVTARLDRAVVSLGDFTLGPIDLELGWAERIALVGANGSGKSTLINTLLGRTNLASGERFLGPSVVVGEMTQARGQFDSEHDLLRTFMDVTGFQMSEARSLLAKFGLGANHVTRTTASLSPGERTRAVLALFMAQGVNFLVLDEPTNHLDMPAIEQLEQALDSYNGTLLVVTHDRRLLSSIQTTRTVRLEDGLIAG